MDYPWVVLRTHDDPDLKMHVNQGSTRSSWGRRVADLHIQMRPRSLSRRLSSRTQQDIGWEILTDEKTVSPLHRSRWWSGCYILEDLGI